LQKRLNGMIEAMLVLAHMDDNRVDDSTLAVEDNVGHRYKMTHFSPAVEQRGITWYLQYEHPPIPFSF